MEMTYVISFDMCSLMCFYPICTRKDLGLVISSKYLSFAFCLQVVMTSSFNGAEYFQWQVEEIRSSRYLLAGQSVYAYKCTCTRRWIQICIYLQNIQAAFSLSNEVVVIAPQQMSLKINLIPTKLLEVFRQKSDTTVLNK